MGKHYVPQHLLRGFEREGRLWVYDRASGRQFRTTPTNIAHECDMYSDELEARLANTIEGPANGVISKIRVEQVPTVEERKALARYIVVLWKRVPDGRARVNRALPEVAASVRADLHEKLSIAAALQPSSEEVVAERRQEVDRYIDIYQNERSNEIWQQTLDTVNSRLIEALLSMRWLFLVIPRGRGQFLLSDNPVYFHKAMGIGNAESELSLPISSGTVLLATRRDVENNVFVPAVPGLIKEMNRRTARNATRFVFAADDEPWISKFVHKGSYQLNRIR
jgi:hypothetical protein